MVSGVTSINGARSKNNNNNKSAKENLELLGSQISASVGISRSLVESWLPADPSEPKSLGDIKHRFQKVSGGQENAFPLARPSRYELGGVSYYFLVNVDCLLDWGLVTPLKMKVYNL